MSQTRYYLPCSGCGVLLPVERQRPAVRYCGPCRNDRRPVRQSGGPTVFEEMAASLVRRGLAPQDILSNDRRGQR